MSKRQGFKSFLKHEGEKKVKILALEYANKGDDFSITSLSKKYGISKSAIHKLFEHVIVNCIVAYHTAERMKAKAHRNQAIHFKNPHLGIYTSSDKFYDQLFEERLETVKSFDSDKVLEAVHLYLEHPHSSSYAIAEDLGLSKKELNILLKKAIIFNIADDRTVEKLCRLTKNKTFNPKEEATVSKNLKNYLELREVYKIINSKIGQLYFQIESYEDFVSSDEEAEIELEGLKLQLKEVKESLQNFINYL